MSHLPLSVAVVGATGAVGAVGAELIGCLERTRLSVRLERLLASERSAGRRLYFGGEPLAVEALTPDSFWGIDIARMHETVPLVVPEVNASALRHHDGLIANPNCVDSSRKLPCPRHAWPTSPRDGLHPSANRLHASPPQRATPLLVTGQNFLSLGVYLNQGLATWAILFVTQPVWHGLVRQSSRCVQVLRR